MYKLEGLKDRINMKRLYMLFSVLRVTVAYRLEGMRMLLDKLACGVAGNRRQAIYFILIILVTFLKSRRNNR
jgi:hypothetical protein